MLHVASTAHATYACQACPYTSPAGYGEIFPMDSFGHRLKAGRLAKGFTQDALADLLGVTKSAVSAWENDRETPAFDKLASIRNALFVSLDELVFGEPPRSNYVREDTIQWPMPPPRDMPNTPEERAMLRVFRSLTDRQRRGLLAAFGKGD